jgi:hypothetical protein
MPRKRPMRRTPLKPSRGTQWPIEESDAIYARDKTCVGPRAGLPGECFGQPERDHVRASHGMGMKSESTRYNGVLLCNGAHHPWKTVHGREARPLLIAYLERFYGSVPASMQSDTRA